MKKYRIVRHGSSVNYFDVQQKRFGIWWTIETIVCLEDARRHIKNRKSFVVEEY